MQVQQTIPIMRIFDVGRALGFYRDFLGFRVDWEHRFEPGAPWYAQLSRGGCTLHLSEHHGDGSPGISVFVWMTGLRAFHRDIAEKGYAYLRPGLEETFYGAICMTVIDPFGNRILYNERIEPAAASCSAP